MMMMMMKVMIISTHREAQLTITTLGILILHKNVCFTGDIDADDDTCIRTCRVGGGFIITIIQYTYTYNTKIRAYLF